MLYPTKEAGMLKRRISLHVAGGKVFFPVEEPTRASLRGVPVVIHRAAKPRVTPRISVRS